MPLSALIQAAARYSERRDALQRWQFGPNFTALKDEFQSLCKRALATHQDFNKIQYELALAGDSLLLGKVRKCNAKIQKHPPQKVVSLSLEEIIRFKKIADILDRLYRSKADRKSFPLPEGDRCNYKMLRASREALEKQLQQVAKAVLNKAQSFHPECLSKSLLEAARGFKHALEAMPGVSPHAIKKVHDALLKSPLPSYSVPL